MTAKFRHRLTLWTLILLVVVAAVAALINR